MGISTNIVLQVPEAVRADTALFRGEVEAFVRGETSPAAFRAYRVPMGIYEQRKDGRFMVRVRIGAGRATATQLRGLAALSKAHGNGVLHVTTRQDIQLHDIALGDTPAVLDGLLLLGLSSRGGGGNTVRNVSACPRAGVCRCERFDVAPFAIAVAEYFLAHKTSFNLPRKYKIAFSGCGDDCAFASIADLGFFAQVRDGRAGFSVFVAGGLGKGSRPAIKVEEFVPVEEAIAVAEAVRRIFDKHGDRSDRNKARLRHVLARLGDEAFRLLYAETRLALRDEGFNVPAPSVKKIKAADDAPHNAQAGPVFEENREGFHSIRLRLPLGEVGAEDLVRIATASERAGAGLIRTSQTQDLFLTGVPADRLDEVLAALGALDAKVLESERPKIIACTGANTCRLGLCLSQNLARAIDERFVDGNVRAGEGAPEIRISGCPNNCGAHGMARVGLEGSARRIKGRLMPHYSVYVGASRSEHGATLAERIATLPARHIPELLAGAYGQEGDVEGYIRAHVADFEALPDDAPEEYYRDFGATEDFSLAGRSQGECGAGVLDIVKVEAGAAQDALEDARRVPAGDEQEALLYKSILAASRALLVLFGVDARKDDEAFAAFKSSLIDPGWVSGEASELLDAASQWRAGKAASLSQRFDLVAETVERVAALFRSLDGELKFRLEPVNKPVATSTVREEGPRRIDLSGVACPLNFVKTKIALEQLPVGDVLEVLLDEGEPSRNVPASLAEHGQQVVEIAQEGGLTRLRVRRTK